MQPTPISINGAYSLSVGPGVTQSADGTLNYQVIVVNRTTSNISVTSGGCPTFVQLFSRSDRTGSPVFDEAMIPGLGCVASSTTQSIAGGDSLVFHGHVQLSFITGLSSGHYFAAIRIAPNASEIGLPAGDLEFRAQ
jgi:hypothetical protein